MKAQTVMVMLLSIATVAANFPSFLVEASREPIYTIPFIGFSDVDAVDFTEGLASGFLKRDIRGQFDGCLKGVPNLGVKLTGTITILVNAVQSAGMGVIFEY